MRISDWSSDVCSSDLLPRVGENLQDHPDVIIRCLDKTGTSLTMAPKLSMLRFFKRMLFEKGFRFTPTDSGGFVKSDAAEAIPDLQLQFAAVRMLQIGRASCRERVCQYV